MIGKCRLYGTECELMNSHFIPKFAFDYLKKTGVPYLRALNNPNVRVQDGPKKYLLSERAEQEFSKRERWFANNIFFPYQKDDENSFDYDENLGYFLISVLWRVLIEQINHPSVLKHRELDFLSEVSEEWRNFLVNGEKPKKSNDFNIFLTSRIAQTPFKTKLTDLYLSRAIDATIVVDDNFANVAVYVKFLRFVVWSVVKGEPSKGDGIKVNLTSGNVSTPQVLRDNFFGSFIKNRIQELDDLPYMNEKQQEKSMKEIMKNEDEFWKSDAGQSMLNGYYISNK